MPTPRDPRPSPAPAAKRISPSRQAAFEILESINANRGNSDTLLHTARIDQLSPLDRNLATTLVMGVLRWQIALDAAIVPLLARAGDPLPPPVAIALRLGAFQLLHLDRIPAHAAISESVELCRASNNSHATGMVNAILRKLAARPLPFQPASPLLQLALKTAHPVWLADRWTKLYGAETAAAICNAGQHQPPLTIRTLVATPLTGIPEGWLPGELLTNAMRRNTAAETPEESSEQKTIFMDEGSQLVAEIAAINWDEINLQDTSGSQISRVEQSPGAPSFIAQQHRVGKDAASVTDFELTKILDTCAAPGGKTIILATRNPTAEILATDSNPKRLEALRHRLQTYTNIRCQQSDATELPPETTTHFNRILVDAPCSGTGTLARNPEIRHRLQPADLTRHAARQRAILHAALKRLAPAGTLVYSTCSLEPEENEAVVRAVLAAEPNFSLINAQLALDHLRDRNILHTAAHKLLADTAIRDGFLRTLPGIHPTDGFFAAIIQRTV